LASTEALLTVKLDADKVVEQLKKLIGDFDILKKIKELEFAVGNAERECHKLLLRVAALEDKVKDLEGWQEDNGRPGA